MSKNGVFLVKDKASIQNVPEVKNENTRAKKKRHQALAFCLDGGQSYFMVARGFRLYDKFK